MKEKSIKNSVRPFLIFPVCSFHLMNEKETLECKTISKLTHTFTELCRLKMTLQIQLQLSTDWEEDTCIRVEKDRSGITHISLWCSCLLLS